MKNKLHNLLVFFEISIKAFEIQEVLSGVKNTSKMYKLHKTARRELKKENPNLKEAYNNLGGAYYRQGNVEKALEMYKKTMRTKKKKKKKKSLRKRSAKKKK